MSTVTIELVDGSRGKRGKNKAGNTVWLTLERTALVHGLVAAGNERLEEAVDAVIASDATLDVGGAHPSIDNLYVDSLSPDAQAPDVVKVRIAYVYRASDSSGGSGSSGDDTTVSTGSTLRQVPANTDRDGAVIKVTYNGTEYPGMTTADETVTTLRFRRTETGVPGYFREKSRLFVGKGNDGPWVGVDPTCEAREYKCTLLQANSAPGTNTYVVDYAFDFRDNTIGKWDQIIYYIDPATGRPPSDVDDFDPEQNAGNGWVRKLMIQEVGFGELSLDTE